MTNREMLHNMINNLNEEGLSTLIYLFGDMDQKEKYNIMTSDERLEELKQIELQKVEQNKQNIINDDLKKAQDECQRYRDFKSSLTGKEKGFFEKIEKIEPDNHYDMYYWQLVLLAKTYNNSLVDGSYDIFRYGFMKGQRAEKAKSKKKVGNVTD